MNPTVRIVTGDPSLADRYAAALAPLNCRYTPQETRADFAGDVVVFDPATVDRSAVERDGAPAYRMVAIEDGFEATLIRIERAADRRRFEAGIDARFEALSVDSTDSVNVPSVVPDSLDVAALGDLYEVV